MIVVVVVVVAMLSHLALLFYYLLIGIRSALLWVLLFDAGNNGLDRATDRATEIGPTFGRVVMP